MTPDIHTKTIKDALYSCVNQTQIEGIYQMINNAVDAMTRNKYMKPKSAAKWAEKMHIYVEVYCDIKQIKHEP